MGQYKIVRIAGMHSQAAIALAYQSHGDLSSRPYAEQQRFLFEKRYMYGDSFSHAMRSLGHTAEEIIYDVEPLQKTWAKEQGIRLESGEWQEKILLSQLAEIRPDVVFFQDIYSLSYEKRLVLKQRIPSIRKVVIFRGFPGTDPETLKTLSTADLLLLGSPVLVDWCRKGGLKPHLVHHFFDARILEQLDVENKPLYPFTFLGSSGYGYGKGHRDRYWMLFDLLEKTELELWIDEPGKEQRKFWSKRARSELIRLLRRGIQYLDPSTLESLQKKVSFYPKLKRLIGEELELKSKGEGRGLPARPLSEIFSNRCREPLFGLDMFRALRASKVVLNKHSNPAQGSVDNIRLFQATGVGTCLLTDSGSNMRDLFSPDQEIVTYSSIDECIEKARYLLDHELVRAEIARAGQRRTLKDHTAQVRIQQIDRLIQEA
jgi:hypothetical protein